MMNELEIDTLLMRLVKVANDESGWDTLYVDPTTKVYWELTYPHSEVHGGGPRSLKIVSGEQALQKYPDGTR